MITLKEWSRIKAVVKDMPVEIQEDIYAETERLLENNSTAPFCNAVRNFRPDEFTETACELMEEFDCDYQQEAAKQRFDAIYKRLSYERALWIISMQDRAMEVA